MSVFSKRRLIQISTLLVWGIAVGWLLRYEAYPGFFIKSSAGYRALFREAPLLLDSWMKILYEGKHIGYSHTQVDTGEDDPLEQYLMLNRTHLELNILGRQQRVRVKASASLDTTYQLQRFGFNLDAKAYHASIRGERKEGNLFEVVVKTGATTSKSTIEIPSDVIIYSPMTEMTLGELKPGQTRRFKTLDPTSLSLLDVTVRSMGYEQYVSDGETQKVSRLKVDYNGMEVDAWLNNLGQVVKQKTPFGWEMELCRPGEALPDHSFEEMSQDILSGMAVPVIKGEVPRPRMADHLRLRLSGAPLNPEELTSGRQRVLSSDEDGVVLELTRSRLPVEKPEPLNNAAGYLASTTFIQSDDPVIRQKANEVIQSISDNADKAFAIGKWVDETVVDNPSVSLPSALDVLKQGEGDCNEHTYLYVALARAAGLPAKIKVGLVYLDGAFYYHAWPAVYLGAWVELDPTLSQPLADATHIALLEGELADQLRLMSMVGKLRVEILDPQDDPGEG